MTYYTNLDSDKIISSLELLSRRIYERFPQSGLYQVSMQLHTFGKNAQEDAQWIARSNLVLRILTVTLVLLLIAALVWTLRSLVVLDEITEILRLENFFPLLESGINDIILLGAGIFFLGSLGFTVMISGYGSV